MSSTTVDHAQRSSANESADGSLSAENAARAEELAGLFDRRYREATERSESPPWSLGRPHPGLIAWLNVEASRLVRPGCRAAVAGAGLGDDAAELAHRGYDIIAFDRSPTAVEWAARRHPDLAGQFHTADLLNLPSKWRRRFDLVVEVNLLAAAPPTLRPAFLAGLAELMHPRGVLLTIDRGRNDATPVDERSGPPHPLSARELEELAEAAGLGCVRPPDDFEDDADPPRRWRRAALHR